MTWEYVPTANHWGKRPRTLGVILHSTRGGASSQETEYAATKAWFLNPNSQVSAHRVVGFDGNGAIMVDDDLQAWHAKAYNLEWLSMEFTEPTIGDAFSEEQYATARVTLQEWEQKYGFPLDREHLKAHSEVDPQKSDPGPLWDWGKIIQLEDSMQSIPVSLDAIWAVAQEIRAQGATGQGAADAAQKLEDAVVQIKTVIMRDPTQP